LERVMVIARNMAIAVHHITVHAIEGRLSVSLDIELDGNLAFSRAHDIADAIEAAVREDLGPEVEVETHIEPLQVNGMEGSDASSERLAAVEKELIACAARLGFVRDVHDVRVRETAAGEIVNFHAFVEPSLSVSSVHDGIDDLERALRERFPAIKRVIGHAEPRR